MRRRIGSATCSFCWNIPASMGCKDADCLMTNHVHLGVHTGEGPNVRIDIPAIGFALYAAYQPRAWAYGAIYGKGVRFHARSTMSI